jgi:hypothetical protein
MQRLSLITIEGKLIQHGEPYAMTQTEYSQIDNEHL